MLRCLYGILEVVVQEKLELVRVLLYHPLLLCEAESLQKLNSPHSLIPSLQAVKDSLETSHYALLLLIFVIRLFLMLVDYLSEGTQTVKSLQHTI